MQTGNKRQIISYPDSSFREGLSLSRLPVAGADALEMAESCRVLARKFSQTAFKNLDQFPFIYFTAGVTEAIDFLVPKQTTRILTNEYRYVRAFPQVSESAIEAEAFYFSYPFSGTGRFEPIPSAKKLILDCSYLFASNMKEISNLPEQVEYVLFGLTKSHNLSDARIGWFFSKRKILSYHVLQYDYGYINGMYHQILNRVASSEPNALYLKYQESFSKLYREKGLLEGDTNLFALSPEGERVPYYLLAEPNSGLATHFKM